ncbi:hypothetical protein Taro_004412 [Colocasia esculenta]|uniref:Uncharacterized protein n=1 Tax=Colocasia esculenta TaxID=4460 RepID=A0A843TM01_COLES|nr:hypothetical protein [Colocasia esculenta]
MLWGSESSRLGRKFPASVFPGMFLGMVADGVPVYGGVACSEKGVLLIEWKPMGGSWRPSDGMGAACNGDAFCPHFPKEIWSI